MGVSWNTGTPKSSILMSLSLINYPFWGLSYFRKAPYGIWQVWPTPWSGNPPSDAFWGPTWTTLWCLKLVLLVLVLKILHYVGTTFCAAKRSTILYLNPSNVNKRPGIGIVSHEICLRLFFLQASGTRSIWWPEAASVLQRGGLLSIYSGWGWWGVFICGLLGLLTWKHVWSSGLDLRI